MCWKSILMRDLDCSSLSKHKIYWLKDRVPYMIFGHIAKHCHQGGISQYKEEDLIEGDVVDDHDAYVQSRQRQPYKSKKVNCPARIIIKKILSFPDYKIDPNNTSKFRRDKMVNQLKKEFSLKTKRILQVSVAFFNNHENHDLSELAGNVLSPDPAVIRQIHKLVEEGVRSVSDMKVHLDLFVADHILKNFPDSIITKTNQRFYLTDKNIRNHMYRAISKARFRNLEMLIDGNSVTFQLDKETFDKAMSGDSETMEILKANYTCLGLENCQKTTDTSCLDGTVEVNNDVTDVGDGTTVSSSSSDDDSMPRGAVLLLIEFHKTMANDNTSKNRVFWEAASKTLAEHGYYFSWIHLINKWTSLVLTYRRVKDHFDKTGLNTITCEFFDELNNYLDDQPSTQTPDMSALCLTPGNTHLYEEPHDTEITIELEEEPDSPASRKRKNSQMDQEDRYAKVVKLLEDAEAARKADHEQLLEEIRKQSESAKERELALIDILKHVLVKL
ncbi:uncharacterized protein LOC126808614 isoform X2 [Patella vulgata]|uniref:uncharacterized protein LOC126808614 isoform X2 n=1 Tax=Patella vulgata TaxID=6465 RepID=UPI0024A84647|nr:uncharacterized protein LOC126808614 isoform X2 [Patella vulgata]